MTRRRDWLATLTRRTAGPTTRTPEQAARLAELLAAGWSIEEELRLLAVVILTRRTDDGRVEHKTVGPCGQCFEDIQAGR